MKIKLDSFEKEIEKESEFYKPADSALRKQIEDIISQSKKGKNINIRINETDLKKLREKSAMEGIPYQTLITSILHKYVTDQLIEEKDILKSLTLLSRKKTIK